MVRANDLVVGDNYFMVTYPDTPMCTPIVLTYTYLGQDPDGVQEDEPGSHFYFRHLPAFHYENDQDDAQHASDWAQVFPDTFSGWGESVPTSFSEDKLCGIETIDGLIEELMRARSRLAKAR